MKKKPDSFRSVNKNKKINQVDGKNWHKPFDDAVEKMIKKAKKNGTWRTEKDN